MIRKISILVILMVERIWTTKTFPETSREDLTAWALIAVPALLTSPWRFPLYAFSRIGRGCTTLSVLVTSHCSALAPVTVSCCLLGPSFVRKPATTVYPSELIGLTTAFPIPLHPDTTTNFPDWWSGGSSARC